MFFPRLSELEPKMMMIICLFASVFELCLVAYLFMFDFLRDRRNFARGVLFRVING